MAMAMAMQCRDPASLLLLLLMVAVKAVGEPVPANSSRSSTDGRVIELDESSFDEAIAAFDYLLVDFYAPWCGHCKRLAPELDEVASQLTELKQRIVVSKIDADKYRNLAFKYEIDGYPTLKLFMHGVPIEYDGSRKAEKIIQFLKKFATPDVSLLDSDSAVHNFIETAGTDFPMFVGFGLDEPLITGFASKYKRTAWFSTVKNFSEKAMVAYNFDKVPALVAFHPKYNEQSVFYGPFEEEFLEEFIRQNQLPLTVPMNHGTLKLLNADKRKIMLTIMEDVLDEKSQRLVKVLRASATANRDFVFAYAGVKQWQEFVETFGVDKKSKLPATLVWNGDEDYQLVIGSESINDDEDLGSQVSRFLEAYKEGRTITKRMAGPSFFRFLESLLSTRTIYIIVFVVALIGLIKTFATRDMHTYASESQHEAEASSTSAVESEAHEEKYEPGDKED